MPIYLDNAATSWPKNPAVVKAMTDFLEKDAGNPGRSGHSMSVAAARVVYACRERLARLFSAPGPERVIFAKNATEALNMIIFGLLNAESHVITTSVEHNAVMRPLRFLEAGGMKLTVLPCDKQGILDPDSLCRAILPQTKLIITTHASNVCGAIQPISEIGRIAREHGVLFAVDAAQTAGIEHVDINAAHIDFLAFTGHKGLGGPQGTGGLVLGGGVDLPPLMRGGTGSVSDQEYQPDFLPDKLESGTLNAVGLAGLSAAVEILAADFTAGQTKKKELLKYLIDGLADIPGIILYGPTDVAHNAGVVSVNIRGAVCSEVGLALDKCFGVLTRTGLHCAPSAHKTIGTFPQGTVRLSLGAANTKEEIEEVLEAMRRIAAACGGGHGR